MSGKLKRHLAKIEQQLAEIVKKEELTSCICRKLTAVRTAKALDAEMNQVCPVHGFRRLGHVLGVQIVGQQTDTRAESVGLDEAIEEYERRLAEAEKADLEREFGSEEFKHPL